MVFTLHSPILILYRIIVLLHILSIQIQMVNLVLQLLLILSILVLNLFQNQTLLSQSFLPLTQLINKFLILPHHVLKRLFTNLQLVLNALQTTLIFLLLILLNLHNFLPHMLIMFHPLLNQLLIHCPQFLLYSSLNLHQILTSFFQSFILEIPLLVQTFNTL